MNLKEKIFHHYLELINEKVTMLQMILADLKESSSNETKSTAGDKHETALAMLQIEQANTGAQLQDALLKKSVLEKIDPGISAPIIVVGSLIKTSRGYLFMSVALGKAFIETVNVIALSPQSPLGQNLMGLNVNDVAEINGITYEVESIA